MVTINFTEVVCNACTDTLVQQAINADGTVGTPRDGIPQDGDAATDQIQIMLILHKYSSYETFWDMNHLQLSKCKLSVTKVCSHPIKI